MKITLFLEDRLVNFVLPNQVSGSYRFDALPDEVDKLINIEAKDNKWVLYSTDLVSVLFNNKITPYVEIVPNSFYVISRNKINYLIYVSDIRNRIVKTFVYQNDFVINIGAKYDSNVCYNNPYLKNLFVSIKANETGYTIISNLDSFFYMNERRVTERETFYKYGNILDILGLKVILLKNIVIFNMPQTGVSFNNFALPQFTYTPEEKQNIIVKDIDLYNVNNYFSKSPRIRRLIEEKSINLDSPPALRDSQKTPLILTLGPMLSLLASSGISLINTITMINDGRTTFQKSWTSFATCGVMLITSFVWPLIMRFYNKQMDKKNNKEIEEKYGEYLLRKEKELADESTLQKSILQENLLSCNELLSIINTRKNNFWCKRKEQNDFLLVRVGIGKVPLMAKVNYPKDGFTLEESNLKKMADDTLLKYKYMEDVPLGYSLFSNYMTAVMGPDDMCVPFINNIILQLGTFYCYDEIKFIVFTDEKHKSNWEYLKYSNYNFSNKRDIRYFATNAEEYKELSDYLHQELQYRLSIANQGKFNPTTCGEYYIIICDNYNEAKKYDFFKDLVEAPSNVGYSTIFIDDRLSNLPSKCVNFITLNRGMSGILNNSYESAKVTEFREEILENVDMEEVMKILSNIPIELASEDSHLPNSIGFLEMEKVGKVEQLNILNRWNSNDSTKSLKAEVGVDSENNLLYLDLHEKYHGPHGLIAGMTGSGKSEFIITYILSMAMNYSPDDVSFVLIDYKGGGLAGAFLNEATGIRLPHLAGTITNLDKAEMDRTLVSIDSEVKRRQAVFNDARDALGESTIDIYKYQEFYHQGKLKEAIPHLFIICDEFAELKSQQPDFMSNLISIARIGRSLGVHLILATQKPSGVVNDQIWSNTKFRVCLKVQDASDSNEMLKKPDAANIKQVGRFYLQVGYDEYYVLGQSAWCGAKYFPSEKMVKTVDKSINFINNLGNVIKNVEDNSMKKAQANGEQIAAVMNEIINVSKQTNKQAKILWLESIPAVILINNIIKKYNFVSHPYEFTAIIGEYDAPETQKQGLVSYNLVEQGNAAIYGVDGTENEMLLNTIIYSLLSLHGADEINIYMIDYGSESLRLFGGAPQIGGFVAIGDDDKYINLISMLKEEKAKRKEMFINYGGEYKNYIATSENKLPLKVVIMNNFDSIKSNIQTLADDLSDLVRDSERYGIVFVMTANSSGSIGSKIAQSISNVYCLHMKDAYDYSSALGIKTKINPKDIKGRGVCNISGGHEFQTCSLVEKADDFSNFILSFTNNLKANSKVKAKKIPSLPENVLFDDVDDDLKDYTNVPYGIIKSSLDVLKVNLVDNIGNLVLSNKIENIKNFGKSLLFTLSHLNNPQILFIDGTNTYNELNGTISNYYNSDFPKVLDMLIDYTDKCISSNDSNGNTIIVFNGLSKFASKIDDKKKLEKLFGNIKKIEKFPVVVFDAANKLKAYYLESWYREIFTGQEGLWIGNGISDQSLLKVSSYGKEFKVNYKNDMGFYVSSGDATLVKLLNFDSEDSK